MVAGKSRDIMLHLLERSLTVVVVAHNDALSLEETVDRLYRALMVTVEEFEIVIYDDGSTDDTAKVLAKLAGSHSFVQVRTIPQRKGPGYCFQQASRETTNNFIAYIPADNTWPYRSFVELFGNIGKADVITSYSSNMLAGLSSFRRLASKCYKLLIELIFRRGLRYYNGLTIYPASFFRIHYLKASGYSFQAEALITALAAGYSFLEVALPTDTRNVGHSRLLNLENVIDALKTVLNLTVKLRFRPSPLRPHLRSSQQVSVGQGVDEIGVGAVENGEGLSLRPTEPLRIAVLGASSGIGAELARSLAADGHRIFACARRLDVLQATAGDTPNVTCLRCDVSQEAEVEEFFGQVSDQVGGLDAMIGCAGSFGEIGPIELTDSHAWWRTLEVNLLGTYLAVKYAIPLMRHSRAPRILNLAGGGAFSAFPNYSAYACSKAAVVRLTECLAVELMPKDIRVNALSPGIVATGIHSDTLRAGEERAGRLQYRRTLAVLNNGGPSIDNVVNCVRAMLSPAFDGLTGKTISSNFDPWQTQAFQDHILDITNSDLYSLRRVNVTNLSGGYLRKILSEAWSGFGSSS